MIEFYILGAQVSSQGKAHFIKATIWDRILCHRPHLSP